MEVLAEVGGSCECEILAHVARDRFGWPERACRLPSAHDAGSVSSRERQSR